VRWLDGRGLNDHIGKQGRGGGGVADGLEPWCVTLPRRHRSAGRSAAANAPVCCCCCAAQALPDGQVLSNAPCLLYDVSTAWCVWVRAWLGFLAMSQVGACSACANGRRTSAAAGFVLVSHSAKGLRSVVFLHVSAARPCDLPVVCMCTHTNRQRAWSQAKVHVHTKAGEA
jgi:hypothetical protein